MIKLTLERCQNVAILILSVIVFFHLESGALTRGVNREDWYGKVREVTASLLFEGGGEGESPSPP